MKRLSTIFVVLACFCSVLTLSACNSNTQSNEPTFERIALTEENYSKYISVNAYISDFQYSLIEDDTQTHHYYNKACIGNIETSKRTNCYFECVSITFSIEGTWDTLGGRCYVDLDFYGNSHGSFPYFDSNSPLFSPPHQPTSIEVVNISGYVLLPMEV